MKKLIPVLVVILVLFSSCGPYIDREKLYDELTDKLSLTKEESFTANDLAKLITDNDHLYLYSEDYEAKYDSLVERIWSFENDFLTIHCFIEGEESVTQEEANDAYLRIENGLLK